MSDVTQRNEELYVCFARDASQSMKIWLAHTLDEARRLSLQFMEREHPAMQLQLLANEAGSYIYEADGTPRFRVEPWPMVTIAPLLRPQQSTVPAFLCTITAFILTGDGFQLLYFYSPEDSIRFIEERISPYGGSTFSDGETFYHLFNDQIVGFTLPIPLTLLSSVGKLPIKPILN